MTGAGQERLAGPRAPDAECGVRGARGGMNLLENALWNAPGVQLDREAAGLHHRVPGCALDGLPHGRDAVGDQAAPGSAVFFTTAEAASPVIVINETMAKRFWTVKSAVGKRILCGPEAGFNRLGELEIIGVVRDALMTSVTKVELTIYQPLPGRALPHVLFKRADSGSSELAAPAVRRIDSRVRTRISPLIEPGAETSLLTLRGFRRRLPWLARAGAGHGGSLGRLCLLGPAADARNRDQDGT